MNTKLTLRMDEDLIRRAKAYADESGKTLSGLVAGYFALLTSESRPAVEREITPRVRGLLGALKGADIDEEDYKRHLLEKYG
jgi:hypothetical protein